jgi:hypothetical protein
MINDSSSIEQQQKKALTFGENEVFETIISETEQSGTEEEEVDENNNNDTILTSDGQHHDEYLTSSVSYESPILVEQQRNDVEDYELQEKISNNNIEQTTIDVKHVVEDPNDSSA